MFHECFIVNAINVKLYCKMHNDERPEKSVVNKHKKTWQMNEMPQKISELKRAANGKSFFDYFTFLSAFEEERELSAFG